MNLVLLTLALRGIDPVAPSEGEETGGGRGGPTTPTSGYGIAYGVSYGA